MHRIILIEIHNVDLCLAHTQLVYTRFLSSIHLANQGFSEQKMYITYVCCPYQRGTNKISCKLKIHHTSALSLLVLSKPENMLTGLIALSKSHSLTQVITNCIAFVQDFSEHIPLTVRQHVVLSIMIHYFFKVIEMHSFDLIVNMNYHDQVKCTITVHFTNNICSSSYGSSDKTLCGVVIVWNNFLAGWQVPQAFVVQ